VTGDAGPLLVRAGLLTEPQLRAAYAESVERGELLVERLIASGLVGEDVLCDFFRERLLVPRVGATDLARVSPRVLALVPAAMAAEFRCLPIAADSHKNLALAMADPSLTHAVDEVRFWTSMTIYRVVAPARAVAEALERHHGVRTPLLPPREAPPPREHPLPPAEIVDDVFGEDTPIPIAVPFDATTGRIVLIDPRSLETALAAHEQRREAPAYPHSEAAMRDAVGALATATDRDEVCASVVGFLNRLCRRAAFFVVQKGHLAGHLGVGLGVRIAALRRARLSLESPSTFRDLVRTRLPYRGPLRDVPSRDFLIEALGWAPGEMLAVPLTVRERVVGVAYGDERMHALPDDHLTAVARAAELAFERALLVKKAAPER
jgi:hypothetical protein